MIIYTTGDLLKSSAEALVNTVNCEGDMGKELHIQSISIPPLGGGNGGLIWNDVKELIERKLAAVNENVQIFIYEPSQNYVSQSKAEPKLSLSALVLIGSKHHWNKFDTLRLQKTAFYMDVFSGQRYFNFERHKFGPYDNSISIVSRNINEFQKHHGVENTDEAYNILHNKIVSDHVESKLTTLQPFIEKAAKFVNTFKTNDEIECLSTITYVLIEKDELTPTEIVEEFKRWSEDKASKFSDDDIVNGIKTLYECRIIGKTLMGYTLNSKNEIAKYALI